MNIKSFATTAAAFVAAPVVLATSIAALALTVAPAPRAEANSWSPFGSSSTTCHTYSTGYGYQTTCH